MGKKFIDDVVKMEWEASKVLFKKGSKLGSIFIFAAHDYETSVGTVTLFFDCDTVFIWASDAGTDQEDRWNAKEVKDWLKNDYNDSFPLNYDAYIPVIGYGSDEVNQDVIEKYGLQEYVDDIKARFKDVQPYSAEVISGI